LNKTVSSWVDQNLNVQGRGENHEGGHNVTDGDGKETWIILTIQQKTDEEEDESRRGVDKIV
jgi:hypothetical protein